ncbi:MAG TPA: BrnA antitoxin family protein [Gemmatirosa sp.]
MKRKSKKETPRTGEVTSLASTVPPFASEAAEREFWQEHDTAGHVDWSLAERVRLPNLKPSTATISLRLPEGMLNELKVLANQRDVPYQSLLKVFLAERIAAERARRRRAG